MAMFDWKPSLFTGATLEDLAGSEANSMPVEDNKEPANNLPPPQLPDPADGDKVPADKRPAIINVDMTPGASTDTSLSQEEIEQIPNWAAQINLIEEDSSRLVSMKEVQADILGGEQMSLEKAENVDATFENFFTPSNPKQGFSTYDSKVGLAYAMRFMDKKIKATHEDVIQRLHAYSENEIPQAQIDLAALKEDRVHDTICAIRTTVDRLQEATPKLVNAVIVLPFSDQRFINMFKEDLSALDINDLDRSVPLSQEWRSAFSKMQSSWCKNPHVRWIFQTLASQSKNELQEIEFGDTSERSATSCELLLTKLIDTYTSENCEILYDSLLNCAEGILQRLLEQGREIKQCQPDLYNNIDFIKSRAEQLSSVSAEATHVQGVLNMLKDFSTSVCTVVCGLAMMVTEK